MGAGAGGGGVYITDLDLYNTTAATAFETDIHMGVYRWGVGWDGMRKFRSWLRFQAWSFNMRHLVR